MASAMYLENFLESEFPVCILAPFPCKLISTRTHRHRQPPTGVEEKLRLDEGLGPKNRGLAVVCVSISYYIEFSPLRIIHLDANYAKLATSY